MSGSWEGVGIVSRPRVASLSSSLARQLALRSSLSYSTSWQWRQELLLSVSRYSISTAVFEVISPGY